MDWRWGIAVGLALVVGIGVYAWYAGSVGAEAARVPSQDWEVSPAAGPDPSLTVPNPSATALTAGQISQSLTDSGSAPMPLNLGAVPALTGVWAANADMCRGGAWHIEDTRVVTDGEMSCELHSLSQQPESGILTAGFQCTGEGVTGPESWRINATAAKEGMLSVTRYGQGEVKLVRCGAVGS